MSARALPKFVRAVHNGQYFLIEGTHLMKERQNAEAEATLREGLNTYPENPQLWHALAKLLRTDYARDAETTKCLQRAYALDPTDRYIAMDYAKFLTLQGHADQAEQAYVRLYNEEGPNNRLLCAMGDHYQKRDMMELAIACFAEALGSDTTDQYTLSRYLEIAQDHGVCYCTRFSGMLDDRIRDVQVRAYKAPVLALDL